jgi:glycogen operon protein
MTGDDWDAGYAKSVAVYLNGAAIDEPDPRGDPVTDDRFLLLFNAGGEPVVFTLPDSRLGASWEVVVDTTSSDGVTEAQALPPKSELELVAHAATVLRSKG